MSLWEDIQKCLSFIIVVSHNFEESVYLRSKDYFHTTNQIKKPSSTTYKSGDLEQMS